MDRNFVAKNWELLQAFKEGKVIQWRPPKFNKWFDTENIDQDRYEYRVKPQITLLSNNDTIINSKGEEYIMMFFKLSGQNYLVPVRKISHGMTRLIEPIKCDDNDCVSLEEINEKTNGSLGPFFKVEE